MSLGIFYQTAIHDPFAFTFSWLFSPGSLDVKLLMKKLEKSKVNAICATFKNSCCAGYVAHLRS